MKTKDWRQIGPVAILLVVGIIIGWMLNPIISTLTRPPKEVIAEKIGQALTLSGQPGIVTEIIDKGELYKLIISVNGQLSELWVTKDGSLLLSNPIHIDSYITEMSRRSAWFDCLSASGLRMYGSTDVNATLLQIQLLGGSAYLDKIYIGCEGQAITNCLEKNITEVPTWVLGNQNWTGVQTMAWVENVSGCVY